MSDPRISPGALQGVPRTLRIPLVGRARARERFAHLAFSDPDAERILARLDAGPDLRLLERDRFMQRVLIVRARALDAIARRFFLRHPEGIGVSLGAGLCTRFLRVAPVKGRWVDVDFPEVIELKRQLVEESERYRFIASSMLDPAWHEELGWKPGTPVLIIIEGVLMYLPPEDVKRFFMETVEHFGSDAELAFDFVHALLVRASRFHPALRQAKAGFQWGVKRAEEVASWHPRLRVHDELSLAEGLGVLSPRVSSSCFMKFGLRQSGWAGLSDPRGA